MPIRRLVPVAALALALTALSACSEPTTAPVVRPGGNPASVKPCSPLEVIAARSSLEAQGRSVVIDPITARLRRDVPAVSAYPVRYPASADFATSVPAGAGDLVDHLVAQAAACPDQRFVVMGHSQGAMVVQHSFAVIPDALFDRVVAVAIFGSPYYKADSPASRGPAKKAMGTYPGREPARWEAKTISFCNEKDIVCGAGTDVATHYDYARYADEVARFVTAKLG
jgi:cutinase